MLGAGVQGVCASLALRRRGYDVTVIDRSPNALLRTSLRNEGKVHLGFLFANDRSMRTAELLMQGALRFSSLVDGWFGEAMPWAEFSTGTFTYCLGTTSLLSGDEILSHYEKVQSLYEKLSEDRSLSYLGTRPSRIWTEAESSSIPELSRTYASPLAQTLEVALDRELMNDWMRDRFNDNDEIAHRYNHTVKSVSREPHGFIVKCIGPDRSDVSLRADIVVNCLWDGRLAIDKTMGISYDRPWVHRLKYRVFVDLPDHLSGMPPMTFVLGPYGDIVTFRDGLTYLSYYPVSIQGWTSELQPPSSWDAPCEGRPDPVLAHDVAERVVKELSFAIPGLEEAAIRKVDAGAIFTWGETDIDDPRSEIHERFDVGVHAHDGYFSIDTGKFTTAPLFADQLQQFL